MIPKILHFIYLIGPNTIPFNINHYLSVKSNSIINSIQDVRLYTNENISSNYYIHKLEDEVGLKVIKIEEDLCTIIGGKYLDVPYMAHQADILRLKLLYSFGGVYADVDSIAVKSIEDFLNLDKPTMCFEHYVDEPSALCNGFIISPPSLDFIKDWLEAWKSYDKNECKPGTPNWTKYSVQKGIELYQSRKYDINILPPIAFQPFYLGYKDVCDLFYLNRMNRITDEVYQVHLWETRHRDLMKVLDDRYFMESDSTYAQLGGRFI